MTLQEAKNNVKEVVESAKDYQSSIHDLQRSIIEYSEEITNAFNSIGNEINENSIVEYSNKNATQIISTLSNTLDLTNSTLNILSSDANKKIREIVDEYNASLPHESREPRLSYYEVALSGIAGSISAYQAVSGGASTESSSDSIDTTTEQTDSESSDTTEKTSDQSNKKTTTSTQSSSSGGGYSSNYYGGNSYSSGNYDWDIDDNDEFDENDLEDEKEPRTETDETINQYIEMFEMDDGVKSADIYGWEDLIKKFLEEHELDTFIDKLELEDNYVKCTLLNSKKYKISNISSVEELLEAIEKILEREELK